MSAISVGREAHPIVEGEVHRRQAVGFIFSYMGEGNMNPALHQFIEQFEGQAAAQGRYRSKLSTAEKAFLEHVWGPAFQYDFTGLQAEYPLQDFKGGDRFADFVYTKGGMRLLKSTDSQRMRGTSHQGNFPII